MGLRANYRWLKLAKEGQLELPDRARINSERAESGVARSVSRLDPGDWTIHRMVRIPNPDTLRGKGEVDVLAVCRRAVLVIEVKSYSGNIELAGDELIQNGEKRGEAIKRNESKAKDLARLFRSKTGRSAPEIIPLLVFANRRGAKISDELLARSDCYSERELSGLGQRISSLDEMSVEDEVAINEMANEFGTWDSITYMGGLELSGDIVESSLPTELSRGDLQSADICQQLGLLRTVLLGPKLSFTSENMDGNLDPDCEVEIILPGRGRQSRTIPVSQLSNISFGHTGLPDWRVARDRRRKGRAVGRELSDVKQWSDFKQGSKYTGTILSWVPGGVLVELDASGIKGMIRESDFGTQASLDMAKILLRPQSEIDVRVVSNSGNRIFLKQDD